MYVEGKNILLLIDYNTPIDIFSLQLEYYFYEHMMSPGCFVGK